MVQIRIWVSVDEQNFTCMWPCKTTATVRRDSDLHSLMRFVFPRASFINVICKHFPTFNRDLKIKFQWNSNVFVANINSEIR